MRVSSLEKKPLFLHTNGLKIRSKTMTVSHSFENHMVALQGLINSISSINITIKKLGELGSRGYQQIMGDILFFFEQTLTNVKQIKKNQSHSFFQIKAINNHGLTYVDPQKTLLKKQIWADATLVLYRTSCLIKDLKTATQSLLQCVMALQEDQFRNDVTSMAMRMLINTIESQFNQSALTCCKKIHILKYQVNRIRKGT